MLFITPQLLSSPSIKFTPFFAYYSCLEMHQLEEKPFCLFMCLETYNNTRTVSCKKVPFYAKMFIFLLQITY